MQDYFLRTPDEATMHAVLAAAGLLDESGNAVNCAIDMVGEATDAAPGYFANVRVLDDADHSALTAYRVYPANPVRVFIGALPAGPSIQEQRALKWLEIKAERDRRKTCGVKVGEKWFHSDADSRIQQLGLVMFGVSVPPVQWKTMDGSFVTMTQDLAGQIFQAVAASDQAIFAKSEEHRAAMKASADPANYDYSAGWPPIFGE